MQVQGSSLGGDIGQSPCRVQGKVNGGIKRATQLTTYVGPYYEFNDFQLFIKEGMASDSENKEALFRLLRF